MRRVRLESLLCSRVHICLPAGVRACLFDVNTRRNSRVREIRPKSGQARAVPLFLFFLFSAKRNHRWNGRPNSGALPIGTTPRHRRKTGRTKKECGAARLWKFHRIPEHRPRVTGSHEFGRVEPFLFFFFVHFLSFSPSFALTERRPRNAKLLPKA